MRSQPSSCGLDSSPAQHTLEELELLGLLAELGGEAVADEIAASICRDVRDFSRDPQAIDFARTRVIEEILKLKQE